MILLGVLVKTFRIQITSTISTLLLKLSNYILKKMQIKKKKKGFHFNLLSNLNRWEESINDYLVFYPLSPRSSIPLVIEEKVGWDVEATKQKHRLRQLPPHAFTYAARKVTLNNWRPTWQTSSQNYFLLKKKWTLHIKLLQKSINFYLSYQMLKLLRYSSVFLKVIN